MVMRIRALVLLFVGAAISACGVGHPYTLWQPSQKPDAEPYQVWTARCIRGSQDEDPVEIARANDKNLEFFQHEFDAIESASRSPEIGLALSGGGIRSAAFALGVLRGLHDTKTSTGRCDPILSKVGYLSTVSGGGYAGGWYVAHGPDSDLFAPRSKHLQHIAGNGHYLTGSHFSETAKDLMVKTGVHVLTWPFAVLLDEAVHWHVNVHGFRDFYRRGLKNTFLYDRPLPATAPSTLPNPFERLFEPGKSTVRKYRPSAEYRKPYWIINQHLVLRDETIAQFRNRSGDAFEVTPDWAGARAVGYVKVENCATKDTFWMQPEYAMAISGAALDSDSLSTGQFVNLLSYSLNLDLGYWIRGWNEIGFWREVRYFLLSPWPLNRLLSIVTPASWYEDHRFTRRSKYFGVTDGGHFENLGAYALIRRGVRLIMIADASYDPLATQWDHLSATQRANAFLDLRKLAHLARLDFGVELVMDWQSFRVGGVPSLLVGTIRGLPGRDLRILVFKAAYEIPNTATPGEVVLELEKGENPKFPDDPLFRQLFTERRMLAYEQLGYLCVRRNASALQVAVCEVETTGK